MGQEGEESDESDERKLAGFEDQYRQVRVEKQTQESWKTTCASQYVCDAYTIIASP